MFQRSPEGLIKPHHGLEPKVSLGPLAAVVVVGARQGHPHGREGGADGDQGAQQRAEQLEENGQDVDQPVREGVGGSWIAQACHHARDEVPEGQGGIIRDEVGLWKIT